MGFLWNCFRRFIILLLLFRKPPRSLISLLFLDTFILIGFELVMPPARANGYSSKLHVCRFYFLFFFTFSFYLWSSAQILYGCKLSAMSLFFPKLYQRPFYYMKISFAWQDSSVIPVLLNCFWVFNGSVSDHRCFRNSEKN